MKKLNLIVFLFAVILYGVYVFYTKPPYYYTAIIKFHLNNRSLVNIHDFMKKNTKVHNLKTRPGSLLAEARNVNRKTIDLNRVEKQSLGKLMIESGIIFISKIESGMNYYMGEEHKFNARFQISYFNYYNLVNDLPSCGDEINFDTQGVCGFHIKDNWFLIYEWHPIGPNTYYELETNWPLEKND